MPSSETQSLKNTNFVETKTKAEYMFIVLLLNEVHYLLLRPLKELYCSDKTNRPGVDFIKVGCPAQFNKVGVRCKYMILN
jgi:hypothetical protein